MTSTTPSNIPEDSGVRKCVRDESRDGDDGAQKEEARKIQEEEEEDTVNKEDEYEQVGVRCPV